MANTTNANPNEQAVGCSCRWYKESPSAHDDLLSIEAWDFSAINDLVN